MNARRLFARHLACRARHHALAILGLGSGPMPRPAMLRSGLAIGACFTLFLLFGRPEAAVLAAFFCNFLCLADKASHVRARVEVQALGGLAFALAGALGMLVAGYPVAVLALVLVVAVGAGWVHGTVPGIEALPLFALCCLIVTAFLPLDRGDCLAAVLLGTVVGLATVILDDAIRHGRQGLYMARLRDAAKYPGPRFSLVYGSAAVCGLGIGLVWGGSRPYWVTVTTLLVMQPDRRINTVRVLQRFLGTLAGVVAAFLIARSLPQEHREAGLIALILVLPFLWPFGYDRNYALGVAVLSTWVLLMIDSVLPSADLATPLFLTRLSDTALGCAVALVGSFAVFEVEG